jgi:hypothetical protein
MKINVEMEYNELKEFMDFKNDVDHSRKELIKQLEKSLANFELKKGNTMTRYHTEISFLTELIKELKNDK